MQVRRTLIFGRFQPFHLGHLSVIRWALERFDELVLLVGMADESHTLRNPFTAGERITMIRESLKEEGISLDRIITATVPTMSVYVGNAIYIQHLVPKIQAIITRNPVIGQVFKDAGLEVIQPPNFNRERLRGTTIRKMILNGGNWEECVPKAVARIIKELDGVERLRRINTSD